MKSQIPSEYFVIALKYKINNLIAEYRIRCAEEHKKKKLHQFEDNKLGKFKMTRKPGEHLHTGKLFRPY